MMRSLGAFAVGLVCLAWLSAASESTIGGQITDSEGAVIANARVLVHWDPSVNAEGLSQDVIAVTNASGYYSANIPPGFYDVFVSAPAFTPIAAKVRVNEGRLTTFSTKLEADPKVSREIGHEIYSDPAESGSLSFDEVHTKGIKQNPPGVTMTIATIPEDATYHLSDVIRFKVTLASQKTRFYTADLVGGGSAAGASFDFVIQGPGLTAPTHSQPSHPMGIVCCASKRRYLGPKPVYAPEMRVSLKRIEWFTNLATEAKFPPPLSPPRRMELKPGDYMIFAQTRSVMRGWPKSQHDAYHAVSDLVVTSSNVLHITILPDDPKLDFEKP